MHSRVTLEAIARASGVSLATVSLVLRDKPGINGETRKRVMDAAQVLGYRRRLGAGIAPRILRQVGVIVKARPGDQPHSNQFYSPVLAGVEATCRKHQINMLYATVWWTPIITHKICRACCWNMSWTAYCCLARLWIARSSS